MEEFAKEDKRRQKQIDDQSMEILRLYHWPGNIRELRNIVERLIIMSPNSVIKTEDIPAYIKEKTSPSIGEDLFVLDDIKEAREKFERIFIEKKLKENDFNISQTAKSLGIERSHLHKKMKSYKIDPVKQ